MDVSIKYCSHEGQSPPAFEARMASARDASQLPDSEGCGARGPDPDLDLTEARWPESERSGGKWLELDRRVVSGTAAGAFPDWKAVTSILWLLLPVSCMRAGCPHL